MKVILKAVSFSLVGIGIFSLLSAGWPILSYEIFARANLRQKQLLSPIPETSFKMTSDSRPYPLNLTQAKNWFVGAPNLPDTPVSVRYYNVSIPSLGISGAVAEIGGDDLAKNLIHYKGTALPGRLGNTVIFGHSTLPQFFKPDNYLSIFSTLPTMKKGDKVQVDYDGVTYFYKTEEMFEVAPTDIQVLEQKYDDSYITLVTCVPPGTYLRRLVVRGRIIPPREAMSYN